MSRILELVEKPFNTLIHPQDVIDALNEDTEVGLAATRIVCNEYGDGRALVIDYDFDGFDETGEPIFREEEAIVFTYSNFAEFVKAGDLLELRTWLIEKQSA